MEKSTCASGKWCEGGVCVANSNVGTGTCILEDDLTFCNSMVAKYSKATVCAYWNTGRCCKFCNAAAVVVPRISTSSMTNMLAQSAGANTFLWSATTVPCVDMSLCSNIAAWKSSTPNICTGNYYSDGYLIRGACPKACGVC